MKISKVNAVLSVTTVLSLTFGALQTNSLIQERKANEAKTAIQLNQIASLYAKQGVVMAKQVTSLKNEIVQMNKATNKEIVEGLVTEDFKIISIDKNGNVRGEKTEGTGEGIYYPLSTFKVYGYNPQVGDKYRFAWLKSNYENEDWDNISMIEEIK